MSRKTRTILLSLSIFLALCACIFFTIPSVYAALSTQAERALERFLPVLITPTACTSKFITYANGQWVCASGGGGGGDFSTNTATSAASEMVVFADTAGKTGARSLFVLAGPATTAKTYTFPNANSTIVTLDAVQSLSNKTLVAPALGTPASGVMTNVTGTAASLTAGLATNTVAKSGNTSTYATTTGTQTPGDCVTIDASGNHIAAGAACGSGGGGGSAGSPLFVQTATATAVTGNSETTILSTGAGSLTIPAAWFTAAGTVLDIHTSGKYSSGAVPGTLQIKLKFGSTVIGQTAAFTPIVGVTDGVYTIWARLVARTVGATGTILVTDGLLTTGTAITPAEVPFANPTLGTPVTVDTTATNVVGLTATWSLAATNSITGMTFEMVGPGSAVSSVAGRTGAIVLAAADVTAPGSTTQGLYNNGGVFASSPALTMNTLGLLSATWDGQAARTDAVARNTTSNTAGISKTFTSGGATVGATDKAAGDLILVSGVSTGTGRGNGIRGQVNVPALTTGTGDNSPVDRIICPPAKSLTNNTATTIVSATLASNTTIAGTIDYAVNVFDGTDLQVKKGSLFYQGINKAGTFTGMTITEPGSLTWSVSAGTVAFTPTISGTNPALIAVNVFSSLTPSAGYPRIVFCVNNQSTQAIATP